MTLEQFVQYAHVILQMIYCNSYPDDVSTMIINNYRYTGIIVQLKKYCIIKMSYYCWLLTNRNGSDLNHESVESISLTLALEKQSYLRHRRYILITRINNSCWLSNIIYVIVTLITILLLLFNAGHSRHTISKNKEKEKKLETERRKKRVSVLQTTSIKNEIWSINQERQRGGNQYNNWPIRRQY